MVQKKKKQLSFKRAFKEETRSLKQSILDEQEQNISKATTAITQCIKEESELIKGVVTEQEAKVDKSIQEIQSTKTIVQNSANKTTKDIGKIETKVQKDIATNANAIGKKVLINNQQNSGTFQIAVRGKSTSFPYKPKQTVIISGYTNKNLKDSAALRKAISEYFPRIGIETATASLKGKLIYQFATEEEAINVVTNWKPDYFGGSSSKAAHPIQGKTHAVIKYVPKGLSDKDVKEWIDKKYQTEFCKRIMYGEKPSHVVRVKFSSEEDMRLAIDQKCVIGQQMFTVEESTQQRPPIIRCFNCHMYGKHVERLCGNKSICGKCSGPHHTRDCNNSEEIDHKCPNCKQKHTADSYECPVYQEYKKKLTERQFNIM